MSENTRSYGRVFLLAILIGAAPIVFFGCGKEPAAQQPAGPAARETASTAQADGSQIEAAIVQTTCPIMEGNPINKALFVEYKGKKVYFCCKGCSEKFLADPEKYVAKLPQFKN